MLLDNNLKLSDEQAVTSTAVSENTLDLSQSRDIAPGRPLYGVFTVTESAAAAGAATVTFEIISSAAADLSSPTVLSSSGPIGKADLAASRTPIAVPLAPHVLASLDTGQRYLGFRFTVATGPLTAGKFTSYLNDSYPSGQKTYPGGYTVA